MTQGHEVKDYSAQRLAPRISAIRDLSVDYEGYSEQIVTRPPDISTRGMFINTNRVFPEGAVLNVQFCLAFSGVEIRSRAEVRYCLAGVGVGVEFIEISSESVAAIQKEIETASRQTTAGRSAISK
jgi:PilZ domain